ncbi:hypothetical protein RHSIM_Rhsim10G0074100 [Rhododendron simsii]|uniref:Uncharacterized protein n=1 Tax=Rhododendron simsii TaxID=118357 RepID=A0A834GEA0_RHOSS|nr:hypothetical protein RHSIM_Rhsim10G0074100 [Rhododendron simsii]
MRWSGVSSTKPWGKRIDDADAFLPRPYAEPVEGALPTSYFSENDRVVDFQTEGITVSASALAAFAAACLCSLLALCAEGTRSMLYRPDKVARQFGYDQGAPGQAPPLKGYVESLRRFTRAFVGELTEGFTVVMLPRNDRETFFTANGRLAWHHNLDSFINYVRGIPEIPSFSDVYHRDVSLRSPKARQLGWRGKKSYWALPTTTPAASRGVTIVEPISTGAPTRAARALSPEEIPASIASVGSPPRHERKEHTSLSKLKRKREDKEVRKGDSDSSIDDTALISRFFKLPRATQSSPGCTSIVVAGKQVVVDLAEGESDGTDSDSEGGDGRNSEGVESSDADGNGEHLGVDATHPIVEGDEEDDDKSSLIPRRRIPTEGFLSIPDINQLAPEAVAPQLLGQEAVKSAFELFHRRVNILPADDLATHFQAHDAAVALTNLTSAEVFADLQDDSLISLRTPQVGYVAGNFGEGSSSLAGGAMLQQHAEASESHGQEAIEDDSDVRLVEPPIANEEEEVLSNEAFFGQFRLTRNETSFLSFIRDRFSYTFSKVRGLYSLTIGQMQLQCLHHFLLSIKDIRVCDLDLGQIEEIGQTVQNFDKLGFDIWWVYKELDAAKIMRENEKLWRHCGGAKTALGEAQAALAKARDALTVAKAIVEERKLVYERMVEEAHLGDRLIDVPLCDTDPFLKKVLG